MKLLAALLALSLCPWATAQQNVPTPRESSERETPRRRNADARELEKTEQMLDVALEALGADLDSLSRETPSGTVSAKAEQVARLLLALCMRMSCTATSDDGR
jgi:hypothetical protein